MSTTPIPLPTKPKTDILMYMTNQANTDQLIDTLLNRGVTEIIHKNELEKKLKEGKPLRIKLGIDPTSPNIHLGRTIPLLKLRDFQNLGHKVIFLIGDFTGVIGDTSDKNAERPMLVEDTVKKNMETYLEQVGKILDISKVEVRRNSEWLSKLSYLEVCKQADAFSINDFISRELVSKRLESGSRVSMRELMYPLMQGYDSVALEADVELGGSDQRFNLLAGRTLQKLYGQPEQQIVMGPLINGLDGRKMSSSWGNTINLMDDSNTMYGKVMSMQDEMIVEYFTLLTRADLNRIKEIEKALKDNFMHPMEAKKELAKTLVTMYHNESEAEKAADYFKKTIQDKEVPTEVPEFELGADADILNALVTSGLVKSKGEARRVMDEKGVKVNGTVVEDVATTVKSGDVLQKGKFNFAKAK